MTQTRYARIGTSAVFTLIGMVFLVAAYSGGGAGAGNLAAGDTPNALPRILLMIWVGLGIVDLFRLSFTSAAEKKGEDDAELPGTAILGVMVLALVLAIAIVFAGYLVPVLIILPLLLYLTGTRTPFAFVLSYLLMGPALWFLFHHLLGIRLPILLSGGLL